MMKFEDGDDLGSTISTISSAYTEWEDEGDGGEDVEVPEMKPLIKVETELVEESTSGGVPLTEESFDDHFLNSYERSDGDPAASDGTQEETPVSEKQKRNRRKKDADEDLEDKDWTTWAQKAKKKPAPVAGQMARRGGRRKQMTRKEKAALRMREKRALMSPEEKEKLREQWRLQAQERRKLKKQREMEEEGLRALVEDEEEEKPLSTRPSRQAKLKPPIKEEVVSADENDDGGDEDDEYQMDEEEEKDIEGCRKKRKSTHPKQGSSTKSSTPRKGRKKVTEMTEEEREVMKAKWREQTRLKRAKQRESMTPEEREELLKKQRDQKRAKRAASKGKLPGSGYGRRKREPVFKTEDGQEMTPEQKKEAARLARIQWRKSMTPEQREEYRKRNREKAQADRANETDEQKEERRRIRREYKRARRAAITPEDKRKARKEYTKAQGEVMTPEQKREAAAARRALKKAEREAMTPEQKREEAQRRTMKRIEKMAAMSEDEKKMQRMSNYLSYAARMARMTPEQREKERVSRLEGARKRREQMSAKEWEMKRQRAKQYRINMTPEQKARSAESMRKYHKRRLERWKSDPVKWEEMKAKWKEDHLIRRQKIKELGENYQKRYKSPALTWRGQPRDSRIANMSTGERNRLGNKLYLKKLRVKKKLEVQKLVESGVPLEEAKAVIEPPEKRERRLIRKRITKAQRILRLQLEAAGEDEEEIQRRLEELEANYQPTYQFRPYKPRPVVIDPEELAILEGENIERKPEVIAKPIKVSPSTPGTSAAGGARRGRRPKGATTTISSANNQQAPPPPPLQPSPFADSMAYHQPLSSPAGGSTCSYASVAESPESVKYSAPPLNHHFQQQSAPQAHSSSQYPYQQHVPTPIYPHQMPQSHPQSYSLQHMIENMSYHQETGGGARIQVPPPSAHHHHQSTYQTQNHHDDYSSSYDNHSPPGSPGGGGDAADYSSDNCADFSSFNQYRHPPPSSTSSFKRGRPRKDEPPRPNSKSKGKGKPTGVKGQGHLPGPRGPKKLIKSVVIRDTVCEECGNAYNHTYLPSHKLFFHNPNYKNQICQLCGEKFTIAKLWYTHYLKDHVQKPAKDMPHMCDVCGQSFLQKPSLEKHKYHHHGEGQKKENFFRCPVCPDKAFHHQTSMFAHVKKAHPGYNLGTRECYRCHETFSDDKELRSHVKHVHPDSYFPCQFCTTCRFTKDGLLFHYTRCPKITKEQKEETKKKVEGFGGLEKASLPCEFCDKVVTISSLTRHYSDIHNLQDEEFRCEEKGCGKTFKRRLYWVVHLEEKHSKTLEEMKDVVRCVNVKSREGLVVANPSGAKVNKGGRKPGSKTGQKGSKVGTGGRGKRGRKKKQVEEESEDLISEPTSSSDEEEEEDNESSSSSEEELEEKTMWKSTKKRRKIVVIADEDEEEEGGD